MYTYRKNRQVTKICTTYIANLHFGVHVNGVVRKYYTTSVVYWVKDFCPEGSMGEKHFLYWIIGNSGF